MKIGLINPPTIRKKTHLAKVIYPPLGLAYIASILRNKGLEVYLLDADALEYSYYDVLNYIKDNKPNIVGFSNTTWTMEETNILAKSIKEFDKEIIIISGGSHPTSDPNDAISNRYIDYIVIGEAEENFPQLVDYIIKERPKLNKIKGIGYRKNGKTIINEKSGFIEDLDKLPMPAYDLLPMDKYNSMQSSTKKVMMMITSRGCPFLCTFCAVPKVLGYKYRYFSPERVVKEIEYLKNEFGIKEIHFKDSIFNINKERISKICDLMIEKKLNIKWLCNARVDTTTKDILKKMKEAGCISILYGIESGSPEILKRLKKGFKIETARETIINTMDAGIQVTAGYIIGNPNDTIETINDTINFAIEMNTDFANFNFLMPLPGTEIYEEALKEDWFLKDYNPNNVTYDKCSINPTNLPTEELEGYLKKAYRKYYFRPSYIIKRLRRTTFHNIGTSYNGLKAIMRL